MNEDLGFEPAIAVDHLRTRDETLARVIDAVGPFRMQLIAASSIFGALAQAIVYQQLNGKAAATIFARFCALFPARSPTAEQVLAASEDELRGAGLSRSKLLSLRDLAGKTVSGEIPTLAEIRRMEDEAIIERLTGSRHRPLDGGDAADLPSRPARCAARGRLRHPQRLCSRIHAG